MSNCPCTPSAKYQVWLGVSVAVPACAPCWPSHVIIRSTTSGTPSSEVTTVPNET